MAKNNPASEPGSASTTAPPGPAGLPAFGCLGGLLRNPMEFWSSIANRFGGIARVPLKARHVYLVSDPDLIYELLITNRTRYRKNTRYRAAVETFGEGLLLSEGEAWRRQRRIVQPTFKADYVDAQADMMSRVTADLIESWRSTADSGEPRDVHEDFLRLTQRVAGIYLMGEDFDRIEPQFYTAAIAIKDNWPLPPRSIVATYLPPPEGRDDRLYSAVDQISQLIFDFIKVHRKDDFQDCGVLGVIARESQAQGEEYD